MAVEARREYNGFQDHLVPFQDQTSEWPPVKIPFSPASHRPHLEGQEPSGGAAAAVALWLPQKTTLQSSHSDSNSVFFLYSLDSFLGFGKLWGLEMASVPAWKWHWDRASQLPTAQPTTTRVLICPLPTNKPGWSSKEIPSDLWLRQLIILDLWRRIPTLVRTDQLGMPNGGCWGICLICRCSENWGDYPWWILDINLSESSSEFHLC